MQKKWRVGVAGVRRGGTYSKLFHSHPSTEVAAICDTDEGRLEDAGKELNLKDNQLFTNYDNFIDFDIDIVVIATPMPVHAEQTIKAMENGKHVLCEVTAATTVEDCERVVDAARKAKKIYMMAENCVYFHYIKEWKKIIDRGKLGNIFYAEGEYVHEIRHLLVDRETGEKSWRADRPLLHYCTHCLGPLLYLMDDRIVKATGSGRQKNIMPDVGVGAIDMQVALFETKKGATIKMLRSQVAPRNPRVIFYSLYGTKGFVENGRAGNEGQLYIEGEKEYEKGAKTILCTIEVPDAPEEARIGHGTAEYYLIRDFINAVEHNTKPPIDVVKAMDYTIPGIIAHKAAMKGNVWLDVPSFEY